MTMRWVGGALAAVTLATTGTAGASTNTYQVTGPVLDVSADAITVQKGKEKWEIARTADTKVTGAVKKGDKVTVIYRMTAESIEAKGDKAEKKASSK